MSLDNAIGCLATREAIQQPKDILRMPSYGLREPPDFLQRRRAEAMRLTFYPCYLCAWHQNGAASGAPHLALCIGRAMGIAAHSTHAATACPSLVRSQDQWQTATPESVGLSTAKLCALVVKI